MYPAPYVKRVENLSIEQQSLIETLETHCLSALIERDSVWFNEFNSKRNRMTRSVENEVCTNPHPLSLQSSAFRVKRQANGRRSIYSAMQLAALLATQDVNIQVLQEHETHLSVNTRSIGLINSTVLRMGKKVAKFLRGMNALADGRLSPDFVKASKIGKGPLTT
jgi:hypothetical protein